MLTLADHEQGPDQVQFWVEEVQRRAGGSLRIQVTNHWRDQEFTYHKATVADVQAGKVQLAKINARAYDTVGIDSFQALVAPFLIDNPTHIASGHRGRSGAQLGVLTMESSMAVLSAPPSRYMLDRHAP